MNQDWIEVLESDSSIKLRDQLGNFIIVPKNEFLGFILDLLELHDEIGNRE